MRAEPLAIVKDIPVPLHTPQPTKTRTDSFLRLNMSLRCQTMNQLQPSAALPSTAPKHPAPCVRTTSATAWHRRPFKAVGSADTLATTYSAAPRPAPCSRLPKQCLKDGNLVSLAHDPDDKRAAHPPIWGI